MTEDRHAMKALKGRNRKSESNIALKQVKSMNEDRVKKGQAPIYLKRRELKELRYKSKFDKLESKGRTEKHMKNVAKSME